MLDWSAERARVAAALSQAALDFRPGVQCTDQGHVTSVSDGVLRIVGLPAAKTNELLRLQDGARALVLGLGQDQVEAIALDVAQRMNVGSAVRLTGKMAAIPAGAAMLGRVVAPLGRPLDGQPLAGNLVSTQLERTPPQIYQRAAVHRPLYTGSLAIDAMFPIGRGQRELLVGEEGTGKTALALDIMLRQRNTDVLCVYVAIGRRRSEVWQLVEALRRAGLERWIIACAAQDASPGLRYLAPYSGTALAEHFSYRGEHTLVLYDDLTAHAVAWRELSLLLRRSPGREAYPGDIFYVHSRLLERAAQLSVELGGGSLTAIPLAVLEGGRLTAYIPTNLISITDGQIVLSQALFAAGQKPAIDAGLSVSRVGSKAQPQALSALATELRLEYSSFLELEGFARLGTRLEATTQRRIDVGRRVRLLLRAARLEPLSLFAEVLRLSLAREAASLLRIPEHSLSAFTLELTRKAERELASIAWRVEHDALVTEGDQQELALLITQASQAAFPGEPN